MARYDLAAELVSAAGSPPVLLIDKLDGWPSYIDVQTESGVLHLAVHLSRISPHARRPYEYRFQNPGDRNPVTARGGEVPLLLGMWSEGGHLVFAGNDGTSRLHRQRRFSILFNRSILQKAAISGWATYTSLTGESIYAFAPALFPLFAQIVCNSLSVPEAQIVSTVSASGLDTVPDDPSKERLRRTVNALVRDARFAKGVYAAYSDRCAMCGLDVGLVIAAHIYPASAPGSPDVITNGLCLCQNHHAAFDRHIIYVNPDTSAIILNPNLTDVASHDVPVAVFAESTFAQLNNPVHIAQKPDRRMFLKRYQHFKPSYHWVRH